MFICFVICSAFLFPECPELDFNKIENDLDKDRQSERRYIQELRSGSDDWLVGSVQEYADQLQVEKMAIASLAFLFKASINDKMVQDIRETFTEEDDEYVEIIISRTVFEVEIIIKNPTVVHYKKNNLWYEKMIAYNEINQCLKFKDIEIVDLKTLKKINYYQPKEILEISESREKYFMKICKHINIVGGMIIVIDYGYFDKPKHFTLQSLHNNKKSNVLDNSGLQDVTSLVDFNQLIIVAKSQNLEVNVFSTQREFFLNYGIKEREKKIMLKSTDEQKNIIRNGLERLIDNKKMGSLFKVLIVSKSYDN